MAGVGVGVFAEAGSAACAGEASVLALVGLGRFAVADCELSNVHDVGVAVGVADSLTVESA